MFEKLVGLHAISNDLDADEQGQICQLCCSISIQLPTNDTHSSWTQ